MTAQVMLSRGSGSSFTPRSMGGGGNTGAYNLYLDPAGTTIWGDNSGGSISYDVYNSTPSDRRFTDFIYGIAPAWQDLAPGTYTDTIFATLSWANNGGSTGSEPPVAFSVTMTVNPECRVDAFALDFGTYNPFSSSAVIRSALLKVYCTRTTVANILLSAGTYPLGSQRRMSDSAGSFLDYDAALLASSGTSTSSIVPVSGGFGIDGSLPAAQDVPSGTYRDTLVATVNY
jgi:spore coat protein U-like protein